MKRLTFVCTGNTCRSPMAEKIFKRIIKTNGASGIRVTSAGINVTENLINSNARAALKKYGIIVRSFKPSQIDEEKAKKDDAIICMTNAQREFLIGRGFDNVCSFDDILGIGDIPDPYGKPLKEYEETAAVIYSACEKLFTLISEDLK